MEIAVFLVGVAGVAFGVWRDLDARRARASEADLRRRLDLLPLVQIDGVSGWEEYPRDGDPLYVKAQVTNHGPGPVRDLTWGVRINGTNVPHGQTITVLAEGESLHNHAVWPPAALLAHLSRDEVIPAEGFVWWVRYSNRIDERLEVTFVYPEQMSGPRRIATDSGQSPNDNSP